MFHLARVAKRERENLVSIILLRNLGHQLTIK